MAWSWQFVLLALLAAAPGCSVIRAVGVLQEPSTDAKNHHLAKTAWRRHVDQYDGVVPYCDDFARGWKAGYFDVASGREGCTPLLPPARYRGARYQNPVGHAKGQAWFDGFEQGAGVAHEEGVAAYAYAPTRRPMRQPRTVPTSQRPRRASSAAEDGPTMAEPLPPTVAPPPKSDESGESRADEDTVGEMEDAAPSTPRMFPDQAEGDDELLVEPDEIEDVEQPLFDEETDATFDSVLEEFGMGRPDDEGVEEDLFGAAPDAPVIAPDETSTPVESDEFAPSAPAVEPAAPAVEPSVPEPAPAPAEESEPPAEDDFNIEDLFGASAPRLSPAAQRPEPFLGDPGRAVAAGRLVGMRLAGGAEETRPAAGNVLPQNYERPTVETRITTRSAAPHTPKVVVPSREHMMQPLPQRSAADSGAALQALGAAFSPAAGAESKGVVVPNTSLNHESGSSRPGAIDFEAKLGRDDRNRTLEALSGVEP